MAQRALTASTAARRLLDPRLQTSYRFPRRAFHNSPSLAGSPFFDLTRLSASRESQHLSKEKGRPRTEFAPHLELIKESEVTPFAKKSDGEATIKAENWGRMEGKVADEKSGPKYGLTQNVIEKSIREQRVFRYLVREVVKIEAAIKDLKDVEHVQHFMGRASVTEEASQVLARTLPNVEEHISSEEIDKAAVESPSVAFMSKKMRQSSEILNEALQAQFLSGTTEAPTGMAKSKTLVIDTARTEKLIASLIKQLQASRFTQGKNPAKGQSVSQAPDASDRLVIMTILAIIAIWFTGVVSMAWYLMPDEWKESWKTQSSARRLAPGTTRTVTTHTKEVWHCPQQTDEARFSRKDLPSRLKGWFWAS
ncbi:MAG: hypothetical protein LQ337_003279 [Flavoplaca oasis]|nr:MAG: hypothetical protein LQ337_003279 [Flavoplaca oasis]